MDTDFDLDDLIQSLRKSGKVASDTYYRSLVNRKDQNFFKGSNASGRQCWRPPNDYGNWSLNNDIEGDELESVHKRKGGTILKVPHAKPPNEVCNINVTMTKIQGHMNMVSHQCECFYASCPSSQLTAADRRHLRAFHKGVLPKGGKREKQGRRPNIEIEDTSLSSSSSPDEGDRPQKSVQKASSYDEKISYSTKDSSPLVVNHVRFQTPLSRSKSQPSYLTENTDHDQCQLHSTFFSSKERRGFDSRYSTCDISLARPNVGTFLSPEKSKTSKPHRNYTSQDCFESDTPADSFDRQTFIPPESKTNKVDSTVPLAHKSQNFVPQRLDSRASSPSSEYSPPSKIKMSDNPSHPDPPHDGFPTRQPDLSFKSAKSRISSTSKGDKSSHVPKSSYIQSRGFTRSQGTCKINFPHKEKDASNVFRSCHSRRPQKRSDHSAAPEIKEAPLSGRNQLMNRKSFDTSKAIRPSGFQRTSGMPEPIKVSRTLQPTFHKDVPRQPKGNTRSQIKQTSAVFQTSQSADDSQLCEAGRFSKPTAKGNISQPHTRKNTVRCSKSEHPTQPKNLGLVTEPSEDNHLAQAKRDYQTTRKSNHSTKPFKGKQQVAQHSKSKNDASRPLKSSSTAEPESGLNDSISIAQYATAKPHPDSDKKISQAAPQSRTADHVTKLGSKDRSSQSGKNICRIRSQEEASKACHPISSKSDQKGAHPDTDSDGSNEEESTCVSHLRKKRACVSQAENKKGVLTDQNAEPGADSSFCYFPSSCGNSRLHRGKSNMSGRSDYDILKSRLSRHSCKPWLNEHTLQYGLSCDLAFPFNSNSFPECCGAPQPCYQDQPKSCESPESVDSSSESSSTCEPPNIKFSEPLIPGKPLNPREPPSPRESPEPECEPTRVPEPADSPEVSEPTDSSDSSEPVDPPASADPAPLGCSVTRERVEQECSKRGNSSTKCSNQRSVNFVVDGSSGDEDDLNLGHAVERSYLTFAGRKSWVWQTMGREDPCED